MRQDQFCFLAGPERSDRRNICAVKKDLRTIVGGRIDLDRELQGSSFSCPEAKTERVTSRSESCVLWRLRLGAHRQSRRDANCHWPVELKAAPLLIAARKSAGSDV